MAMFTRAPILFPGAGGRPPIAGESHRTCVAEREKSAAIVEETLGADGLNLASDMVRNSRGKTSASCAENSGVTLRDTNQVHLKALTAGPMYTPTTSSVDSRIQAMHGCNLGLGVKRHLSTYEPRANFGNVRYPLVGNSAPKDSSAAMARVSGRINVASRVIAALALRCRAACSFA